MRASSDTGATGALIYACSPRVGGNSDQVARLLAQAIAEEGGLTRIVHLREHALAPCTGCHSCERDPAGRCHLARLDDSEALFAPLLQAQLLFFASPIYFYHLPAQFKAFIDRGQSFYVRQERADPALAGLPPRQAGTVLVAGRRKGEQLFTGSLLTLKYFLRPFRFSLAEPLLLPGLDASDDLTHDAAAQARVLAYARRLWQDIPSRRQLG